MTERPNDLTEQNKPQNQSTSRSSQSNSAFDKPSLNQPFSPAADHSEMLSLESGIEALQSSDDFHGPAKSLHHHDSNDHLALIHENQDEQVEAIVPFIKQGLERDERCLYVADDNTRKEILDALREGGIDVETARESGALSIYTKDDTYLRTGEFDKETMLDFWREVLADARDDQGYEGVRAAAEMTWVLDEDTGFDQLVEYESLLNNLYTGDDYVVLCQYNRERFPAETLRDVLRTHPHIISNNTVCQNFYYTPPEEFFGPEQPEREVDRMMQMLVDRTEAKTELENRKETLRQQNDITSDPHRSFEEKLQELFELGCERFGLELGAMARVDSETDLFEIEYLSDDHEHFEEGLTLPLSQTYCTAATDNNGIGCVANPFGTEYEGIKVQQEFGLHSYLGMCIEIDGGADRTFFFVSSELRDSGFTESERTFHELMGRWVKHEIERDKREQELRESKEHMGALVETTPECIKTVASDGTLLQMNSSGLDMVQADTGSDVIGENVYDLIAPEDRQRFREFNERICEGASETLEFDIIGLEGRRLHMESHAAPIHRPDGTTAQVALTRNITAQRQLYETTSNPDMEFEGKLERIFEIGCEQFDLELGGIARIDQEEDLFEVEYISGEHDHLIPGAQVELSETYCKIVADNDETNGITDPVASGFGESAAYNEFGVKSYLGTRLDIEAGLDRTFFFVSNEPRDTEFTNEERTFHHLMGQWVQYELEQKQNEEYQQRLYDIASSEAMSFDRKIAEVLELGRERLGADIGALTHERQQAFEIEKMQGKHPDIGKGTLTPPMTENYCRRVVTTGDSLCVGDVGAAGWEDDLYTQFDLCSYAGSQVTAGEDVYGTVFFSDLEARDTEFSSAEQRFVELIGQWVSYELEQNKRECQLEGLNELSRDMMNAQTIREASEQVVDSTELLGLPVTAVALYDKQKGALESVAATELAEDALKLTSHLDIGDSVGWDTFINNEPHRVSDPLSDAAASIRPEITELVAFPLADHGVLIIGSTKSSGVNSDDFEFSGTVATNVRTAFDRIDREQQLQDREQSLADQNETLERLNQINMIIRNIDQELVSASTRPEIENVACEQLVDAGPYELAWVGEHDAVTDEIIPREQAGSERRYLDEVTITAGDDPKGQGPAGRAVKTHEPQVVNNILHDESFEPWRQAALNRGYHAGISLPLVYDDTLYGVLNLYAGQPNVFDDLEQAVLTELSDNIAYAINAIESKKALMTNEVTEIEFTVKDRSLTMLALADKTDCEVSLETIVPQSNGEPRTFFTTRGAPADDVLDAAADLQPVTDLEVISECTEDETVCLFEAVLNGDSLPETVLEHGGTIQRIDAANNTATVAVHLASDADTREFVEMFQRKYPDSEPVAQRNREQPQQSPSKLRASLTEDLTARQLEAIQTAYFSGYFERPRTRNGSEIAETMDITQPTFNTHVRSAQRKLCQKLFEQQI